MKIHSGWGGVVGARSKALFNTMMTMGREKGEKNALG